MEPLLSSAAPDLSRLSRKPANITRLQSVRPLNTRRDRRSRDMREREDSGAGQHIHSSLDMWIEPAPQKLASSFQEHGFAHHHGTVITVSDYIACRAKLRDLLDSTKISDLAERRKIQNRIAQRNYRMKLKKRLEDLKRRVASCLASPEQKPAELQPTLPSRFLVFRQIRASKGDISDIANMNPQAMAALQVGNMGSQRYYNVPPHLRQQLQQQEAMFQQTVQQHATSNPQQAAAIAQAHAAQISQQLTDAQVEAAAQHQAQQQQRQQAQHKQAISIQHALTQRSFHSQPGSLLRIPEDPIIAPYSTQEDFTDPGADFTKEDTGAKVKKLSFTGYLENSCLSMHYTISQDATTNQKIQTQMKLARLCRPPHLLHRR